MVSNIVLRNLSPVVVKGASPLGSTKADERDGSRPSGGNGGGTPIDPPESEDPRFSGSTYPPIYPGGAGLGTPDPAFSFDRFEYLGSFNIPSDDGERDNYNPVITFNPPNGSNGANGSLFVSFTAGGNSGDIGLYEYQIPESFSQGSDHFSFTNAVTLQNITDIREISVDTPKGPNDRVGWMKVINGKLFINTYFYYNTEGQENLRGLLIIDNPSSIETSTNQGWMQLKQGPYSLDKMARYCFEIPATKRSSFDNNTHLSGVFLELAGVLRSSEGPSLFGFNANNILSTDSVLNSIQYMNFDQNGADFYKFQELNSPAWEHYESLIGMSPYSWARVPKGATTPPSRNRGVVTNELVTLVLKGDPPNNAGLVKDDNGVDIDGSTIDTGLIDGNHGVYPNTVVVRNQARTVEYTLGVDYDLQVTTQGERYWGTSAYDGAIGKLVIVRKLGGSISQFETVSVDYEYLTQRYDDLTEYPAPDRNLLSDAATISTGCGFGMIVPNSNTIMLLGENRGSRFGLGYKARNLQFEGSNAGGGFHPIDNRDCDNFYWLININDLLSAPDFDEVPIYEYGVFDNNRWYENHISYYKSTQNQQAITYRLLSDQKLINRLRPFYLALAEP